MATLEEVRQQFPQYNDLSDEQLAGAIHKKFYSDISKDEFEKRIGLSASKKTSVGMADAVGRGAARGMTANFYDELVGLAEAGGRESQTEPLGLGNIIKGGYRRLTGDQEAEGKYKAAVDRERGLDKQYREERPYSSIAGDVAGAIALPVGGALNAATMGGRMARSAALGAGYGAAAGAGAGTDGGERLAGAVTGGGLGAAAGAAAPPLMAGIEAGVRGLGQPIAATVRGLRNPDAEASRRVVGALERDMTSGRAGLTPAEYGASRAAGDQVGIIDMGGETTRALARSAANSSPEGRAALETFTQGRFESQAQRAEDMFSKVFPLRVDPEKMTEMLEKQARRLNQPAYQRAYREGSGGLWTDELERLTSSPAVVDAMKAAATKGKDRAVTEGFGGFNPNVIIENGLVKFQKGPGGVPTYPNLQYWDSVRRELSDVAEAAKRAGRKEEHQVVSGLARKLNEELDNAVPSYRTARAGAARYFGAEKAQDAGRNFATQSGLKPKVAQRVIDKMNVPERELFANGYASALIAKVKDARDGRSILNIIGESPAAREKMIVALGKKRAEEVEAFLHVERIKDMARKSVVGNSTTARQLTEMGLAGGTYGAFTGDLSPQGLLTSALVWGAMRKGAAKVDQRVARRVAEMLVSDDPNVLRQGLQTLARSRGMIESLRAVDKKLASVTAQQGPGPTLLPSLRGANAEVDGDD